MSTDPNDLLRDLIEALGHLDLSVLSSGDPQALDRALLGASMLGSALTDLTGEHDDDPQFGAPLRVRDTAGVIIPIIDDDDPVRPVAGREPHEEAG
ncbi:hypothetical protein [Janibacter sp. GXQ6167]|uniref:hypothetical protein n=1 Tax=Janibacter sp. GXQ6167 TaxID=3240791 RepID=UPI003525BC07